MSFSPHHYCKRCRTCNTLTCSTPPEASTVDATLCQEPGVGACLGSGDAFATTENVDKIVPEQFRLVNLDRPSNSHYVSSSSTPNTPVSDSSTPHSDAGSNSSDIQAKPSLPKDSLLQYLQHEKDSKIEPTIGQFPMQNRSVVGQEKLPIFGAVSGGSPCFLRGTSKTAPKERRRWVRPPLVGQAASNTEMKILSDEFEPPGEQDTPVDESVSKTLESDILDCSVGSSELSGLKHDKLKSSSSNESGNNLSVSKSIETGDSTDENLPLMSSQTTGDAEQGTLSDSCFGGKASPSSSIASHKRLEWDSGADVGYQEYQNVADSCRSSVLKLSPLERLGLIQDTDKAFRMRLDPEGTSSSVPSTGNILTPTFNTYPITLQHSIGLPSAESTPTEQTSSLKRQRKIGAGSLGISPITIVEHSKQACASDKQPEEECNEVEETEEVSPRQHNVPRTRSASLLNLSSAAIDPSQYLYLYRSQSDPDISADAGTHTDDSLSLRYSPRKPFDKRGLDTQSLSSGSSNTLIHVPTKENKNVSRNISSDLTTSHNTREPTSQPQGLAEVLNSHRMTRSIPSKEISVSKELTMLKGYTCSDTDHKHGLHHHYGVLCSSSLVIPNEFTSNHCPKQTESNNSPESHSSSVNSSHASLSHSESVDSRLCVKKKNIVRKKFPSQERSSSASPPIDSLLKGRSTYIDKATSFDYLPGHVYESEVAAEKFGRSAQQRQYETYPKQLSSGSSCGDLPSTSRRHQLNHLKQKVMKTSSSDSDTDSEGVLWSSPRAVSSTLVRDLERGVNLLRGIVYTNPHRQREIVKRVVRRIVHSEYTDDVLERQLCRHKRNPFSVNRFYGAQQLPSLSTKTESEPRIRSAPVGGARRVQSSIVLKAPFLKHVETKKHADTGSERSDTLYSAAGESSSLQSSSVSESQKSVATGSTTNQGTIRANNNLVPETQPSSLLSNHSNAASEKSSHQASDQPSNPASEGPSNSVCDQPSMAACEQPSNPASELPCNTASKQPSNATSVQSSNSASDPPSDPASERPSNSIEQPANPSLSTDGDSLKRAPSVVSVATVTTKPAIIDASTTTSQAIGGAVSFGTLSSVVSISPMTITVQSSPASTVALPMREVVASELPVSVASSKATVNASTMVKETVNAATMVKETVNASTMSKETANVATMTSPHSCVAEPTSSAARPELSTGSEAGVADGKETRDSREERRVRKNASSSRTEQQLQLINRDISYLRNLQKMLMKHPQIVISSPMKQAVSSSHSASRKAKERNVLTSEDNIEYERRHRPPSHSRAQDDQPDRLAAGVLKRTVHELSSADSRSTVTSSSMFTTSSASNSAPDGYACGAGDLISSRDATEDDQRLHRSPRTEQSHKSTRKHREPSPESEDSVTRAVTHVVSSRVKALRNLGQIEEAEVKIRVRMGQPSDTEGPPEKSVSSQHMDAAPKISISQVRPSRTHKSVRDPDDFDSKRAELDELIARQRAMDAEARKKLKLLNEMRENVMRRTALDVKSDKVDKRDACTLTSVDTATNTTPLNSATHVVSPSTPKESTAESSSESAPKRSSCPACRVRAATRKRPEDVPMCRHDPGFVAGQPRGRQRPPISYFLKVEEEEMPVRAEAPPRAPSMQVVTVKVPRSVRPPSSLGSSGSVSSSSSSSKHSPVRSRTAPIASSVPAFTHESRTPPEPRKTRLPKRSTRRELMASRSEPELGRGDANKFAAESSSDEHTAHDTLQDHLVNNYPDYIAAAEQRRQCISEMSYLRRLRQESRKRLLQLNGDAWVSRQKQMRTQKPSTAPAKPASKPKTSGRSMRLVSAMKHARAPEVEQKKLEMKKKEDNRTNRLRKEIYTMKLREKVLRGQTTLKSSASVISSY